MMKKLFCCYPNLIVCFLGIAALTGLSANNCPFTDRNDLIKSDSFQNLNPVDIGIPAKTFYAVVVDKENTKWFLTELGIISLSGEKWTLHNDNSNIGSKDLRNIAYEASSEGPDLLIASPSGVTVASLPIGNKSNVITYNTTSAAIVSNNVVRVAVGNSQLRWFGTDKGISAFSGNKWLALSYEEIYPGIMFQEYPITSMATNANGDSLYVGTEGAGIARIFRNDVDVVSGASVYAQWGPIILPSDKIYSIYIAPDHTKWFGTDQGLAMHKGNNTLENWTVFTTEEGLVDNFVQAITEDKKGNLWFGTKGGISVYNGAAWTSYTIKDGLNSNNVLCLTVDNEGVIWIGTDDGVTCFNNGKFISYR